MPFSSFQFIGVFLPLVLASTWLLSSRRTLAHSWLTLASIVFYGWYSPRSLPVLFVSVAMNWAFARRLVPGEDADARRRRAWLWIALGSNVFLLCAFKYGRVVAGWFNPVSGTGFDPGPLPLGLSFFTLQQIVYLMDCYEGLSQPLPLRQHALIVSFFPTVSAGPITRPSDIARQLDREGALRLDWDRASRALFLFILGLGKKVVIADTLARLVDAGYASTEAPSLLAAWATSTAFTLQLYFDFSGYSDMALALGLWFGIDLPQNFNSPYRATSVIEFWKRWHITLSRFITTYLYTPLVRLGGKVTFGRAMAATLFAMTIAGIWHGPTWNFALFGALHGVALVLNNVSRKRKLAPPRAIAWLLTFLFVNASFVVFRAPSVGSAARIFDGMIGGNAWFGFATLQELSRVELSTALAMQAIAFALVCLAPNSNALAARFRPTLRGLAVATGLLTLVVLHLNGAVGKEFVYVDF